VPTRLAAQQIQRAARLAGCDRLTLAFVQRCSCNRCNSLRNAFQKNQQLRIVAMAPY
jgi:hypothetical protein